MQRENLLDYAVTKALSDKAIIHASSGVVEEVKDIFNKYIIENGKYEVAEARLKELDIGTEALDIVTEIMKVDENPIPYKNVEHNFGSIRRKTRQWTHTEDIRLLAAIMRYDKEDWQQIANFVGNGRIKCQCAQRWTRGLNPKIKKSLWSEEEELKLLNAINNHGDRAWSKIASDMGDRSDVQCRYHYLQSKKNPNSIFSTMPKLNTIEDKTTKNLDAYGKQSFTLNPDINILGSDKKFVFSYFEGIESTEQILFELSNQW